MTWPLWETWFAWHPVRTLSGRWVFWRSVERRPTLRFIDTFDCGDYDGPCEYRLPLAHVVYREGFER